MLRKRERFTIPTPEELQSNNTRKITVLYRYFQIPSRIKENTFETEKIKKSIEIEINLAYFEIVKLFNN